MPEPDGAIIATNSPTEIASVTPTSADTVPYLIPPVGVFAVALPYLPLEGI